ncbi:MAG: hypothetical protein GX549_01375 [Clostridiales bacterium]|nr:hypothetical protein [Clostridiales bacterium]
MRKLLSPIARRDAFFCPVEECDLNHGGYCAAKNRSPGWRAAAFLPGDEISQGAPFDGIPGPAPVASAYVEDADAAPQWRSWRNCPYFHSREM